MFRSFKSQSGFSLVSVMIAIAAVAILSKAVLTLSQNSSKISSEATQNSDINEAYNRVQKYLLNSSHCSETLTNIPSIPLGSSPVSVDAIWVSGPSGSRIAKLSAGEKIGKSSRVVLDKIEFERIDADHAEFILDFDKSKPGSTSKRIIRKRFEVAVDFDTTHKPIKCFSQLDNAVETACKSIDPNATISGTSCLLSDSFKQDLVNDAFIDAKRTELFVNSSGGLSLSQSVESTRLQNTRCNDYPIYPSCPSGWSSVGTGQRRNSAIGDGCGARRRKFSWRDCSYTPPSLGNLYKL